MVLRESFDSNDLGGVFGIYGPYRIESGTLVMEREEGYQQPPDMWVTGGMYGQVLIPPNTTSILLFKVKKGTTFHVGYSGHIQGTGEPLDFHFNSGFATWEMHGVPSVSVKLWHAQQPKTEVWYYFLIQHNASGEVKAAMWERDNPESRMEFDKNLGSDWATLYPTFYIHFHDGAVTLDEYQELMMK